MLLFWQLPLWFPSPAILCPPAAPLATCSLPSSNTSHSGPLISKAILCKSFCKELLSANGLRRQDKLNIRLKKERRELTRYYGVSLKGTTCFARFFTWAMDLVLHCHGWAFSSPHPPVQYLNPRTTALLALRCLPDKMVTVHPGSAHHKGLPDN